MQTTTNRWRKSMRMRGYSYATPGYYAVTICTHEREYFFGAVEQYEMKLSDLGRLADAELQMLAARFEHVELDSHAIMPNHVHAIFALGGESNLNQLIAVFKSRLSRLSRRDFGADELWQRKYCDHVIRNNTSLQRHREYILANPTQWDLDELNKTNWAAYMHANPNVKWKMECSD